MKRKNLTPSNIIFAIFIILLIIPQTRTALQVALNSVRVKLFSPSILDQADQTQIEPFKYQLEDLNNNPSNAEIGQGKVVFLSYWATWCPPCIAELPSIQKLYDEYGSRIDFVLITDEDPEKVREFLKKKNYKLPVFIPRMPAPTQLYTRSIPTNYIIDQKGNIIVREQGATDWNSQKFRGLLAGLINN